MLNDPLQFLPASKGATTISLRNLEESFSTTCQIPAVFPRPRWGGLQFLNFRRLPPLCLALDLSGERRLQAASGNLYLGVCG